LHTCTKSLIRMVMRENGLVHKKKRNPLRLTKADKEAQAGDDLLKRDFSAEEPDKKWVTDITQLPTADGKLYISGIFNCFDSHANRTTTTTNNANARSVREKCVNLY